MDPSFDPDGVAIANGDAADARQPRHDAFSGTQAAGDDLRVVVKCNDDVDRHAESDVLDDDLASARAPALHLPDNRNGPFRAHPAVRQDERNPTGERDGDRY
ncbi:hypothetical protein [Sphingomonas sp. ZB1N12]|uniref:hypothetical protein n=1 Tax=Sphingomonas arabinosi TaxID=3096160 RepID=UPI003FA79A81